MKHVTTVALLVIATIAVNAVQVEPAETRTSFLARSAPEALGMSGKQLAWIDAAVQASIEAKEIPGAVVLVARHGRIADLKAIGHRALVPKPEPMTLDTIFDMASLTKVVATSPSIMLLVEQGRIRLDDRVKRYLPKFTGGGKDNITVRQLLVHYSGLRPDFDLAKPWEGYEAALEELYKEETQSEPGKQFVYSDLNFIALGEIVRSVSGQRLDVFAKEHVFRPLGMKDTSYNPAPGLRDRIAPTESRNNSLAYLKGEPRPEFEGVLRGTVHDPTAWRMGGVAGHAGVFSTARDVAIYAQMLLDEGRHAGRRFLAPLTVKAMTTQQSPHTAIPVRGYGWDIDTPYSAPRGDIFAGGYGHTGFTGTSLWVHPPTGTFIVVLTNRLHPDGKAEAPTHLRGVIANIVAGSIVVLR